MANPAFEVEVRTAGGDATGLGNAGPYTLVVDRPDGAGGRSLGFNGGQLLYLAVAGCVSNDLYREAQAAGISLTRVRVIVTGDFSGDPPVSDEIVYRVEIEGDAPAEDLDRLVRRVDEIAEIPNSLRAGTSVTLADASVGTPGGASSR
ncbi:MAG: OsmC family protein [Solirubrobacteraceae bacterium]